MIRRMMRAVRRHWLSILIGAATGLYVAFAACLSLMVMDVAWDWEIDDTTLANAMLAIQLAGLYGGGVLGYVRRRDHGVAP